MLYHSDPTKLQQLLYQSLGKFSDLAGVTITIQAAFEAPESSTLPVTAFVPGVAGYYAPMPACFKDVAMARDAKGLWHEVAQSIHPDTGVPCLAFFLLPGESIPPMTIEYFVDLRVWPEDQDLPNGVVAPVFEHLVATIDIYNTERERAMSQESGQQLELPSKSELMQRVDMIEAGWVEGAAYIGSTVIW